MEGKVPDCIMTADRTMLGVYDKQLKRWIKIEIVEPVTITIRDSMGWKQTFTSYHIVIETNHWAFSLPCSDVRRRYSEFVWLREKLQSHHPHKILPPLPPKRFFHMTKFNADNIEERRFGLGKFLQRVMRSCELLSDAALHLFLQSDLTIPEMEQHLEENSRISTMCRLNPRLLRSLSTGSYGGGGGSSIAGESDSDKSEVEFGEQDGMVFVDMAQLNKMEDTYSKEGYGRGQELVDLTITHEDSDEVVQVARSPSDLPILSSLIMSYGSEASRMLQLSRSISFQG